MFSAKTYIAARMETAARHGMKWTETDIIPGERDLLYVSYGPLEEDIEVYSVEGADGAAVADALAAIREEKCDALCDAADTLGLPEGEYSQEELTNWLLRELP